MESVINSINGTVGNFGLFPVYLVVVNVVTFILFAIDYAITRIKDDEDTGLFHGTIMTLFAVAGGAGGMLLALALFTRLHICKANAGWWFSALFLTVLWTVSVLCWAGIIDLRLGLNLSPTGTGALILMIYFAVMNVLTFFLFFIDKRHAERGERRISVAMLMGMAFMGGAAGGYVAMRAFNHKTHVWYFSIGLPAFFLMHLCLVLVMHSADLI